jgi:hypothetical protein
LLCGTGANSFFSVSVDVGSSAWIDAVVLAMLIVVFVECVGISVDFVLVCRFWRHCCSCEHQQVMQLWEAGHLKEVYCYAQPTSVASPTVSIVSHFIIVYIYNFLVLKMVVVFLWKVLKKVIIRKKLLLCDAVLCLVLGFLMLQPSLLHYFHLSICGTGANFLYSVSIDTDSIAWIDVVMLAMLIVVILECVGILVDFVLVYRFWWHCCSCEHRQVMWLLVASPIVSIVSHFIIVYIHSFLVLKMVAVFLGEVLKKVIIRKKLLLCDVVLCLLLDFLMLQPYSAISISLFVGQVLTFSFLFLLMMVALLE